MAKEAGDEFADLAAYYTENVFCRCREILKVETWILRSQLRESYQRRLPKLSE